ncbi:MAG: leucyl aminopeptidase [Anaerolineae bacterium]|nr:leucyl aminopeptidase [Anaerolineae bacterium]
MEINATSTPIQEQDRDAIIVGVFNGAQPEGAAAAIDAALGGALGDLIASGDVSGKAKEAVVLYPRGAIPARRVIAVGLGEREDWNAEAMRRAAAQGVKKARELKAESAAIVLPDGTDVETAAAAIAEGSLLASYYYHGQKSKEAPKLLPTTLDMVFVDTDAAQRGIAVAQAIAAGVAVTRDLVNLPPNICDPAHMARTAEEIAAAVGLHVEILERKQMEALGMGALLAVAQGSDAPPRFIILEHNAARAGELETVVLIGKGVTFDTGGYNLKPGEGMSSMKCDMAGAAAVLGAMRAIAALDVPLHVVGLAPASDNMINGHAYRPQEVVTASNGVTIEVINTDAEGRMLLADALVFAKKYDPAAVVDIATLTGAKVVALGNVAAGLFSTDDTLRDALVAAGEATAERVWPLPLYPEYDKSIESDTADVKNTSGKRDSGVGMSAAFLKHFVAYPAWAHVDMAGMAMVDRQLAPSYAPKEGAAGFGVRLLTEFVRRWAEK